MPVPTSFVGSSVTTTAEVDSRWTMAHAASIAAFDDVYLDTTGPIVAHPMFAVCVEWPAVLALRSMAAAIGITGEEARRGVHAEHDLVIERLVRAGDRLTTEATTVAVEPRSPGAFTVTRFTTTDDSGEVVMTSHMGTLYRGVEVVGEPVRWEPVPTAPIEELVPLATIPLGAGDAHTYTECARIWNPIHTDRAVALAAGLPAIILHGTATLAHAVSAIIAGHADGDPRRVRRVGGRFGAMVTLPGAVTIRSQEEHDGFVRFDVTTGGGARAITGGLLELAGEPA